jgi:hypothetical protein
LLIAVELREALSNPQLPYADATHS